jgi:hypothetical protein
MVSLDVNENVFLGIGTVTSAAGDIGLIKKEQEMFPMMTLLRFLNSVIEKFSVVGLLISTIKLLTAWTLGGSGSNSWNVRVNETIDPSLKTPDTDAFTTDEHGDAGALQADASLTEKNGKIARTIDASELE